MSGKTHILDLTFILSYYTVNSLGAIISKQPRHTTFTSRIASICVHTAQLVIAVFLYASNINIFSNSECTNTGKLLFCLYAKIHNIQVQTCWHRA